MVTAIAPKLIGVLLFRGLEIEKRLCQVSHSRRSPLRYLAGETRLVSESTWDEEEHRVHTKLLPRDHPKAWAEHPHLNFLRLEVQPLRVDEMSP